MDCWILPSVRFMLTSLGSYFAAYEVTKKALTPAGSSPSDLNLGAVIFAGGTAGVAMWALAIPPDVRRAATFTCLRYWYADTTSCAGIEIPVTIRTDGDVLWLHGLRTQNHCTGWRQSAVEGLRTRYGSGESQDHRKWHAISDLVLAGIPGQCSYLRKSIYNPRHHLCLRVYSSE